MLKFNCIEKTITHYHYDSIFIPEIVFGIDFEQLKMRSSTTAGPEFLYLLEFLTLYVHNIALDIIIYVSMNI